MKKLIDILIASIVGILILVAGMTRFHHHLSDDKVCFCVDDIVGAGCCHHHHTDHDKPLTPFGSQSETSCPLHIDLFKITENHNHIHISDNLCCNHNCDLCSPEVYTTDHAAVKLFVLSPIPSFERDGYDSVMSRRGPPAYIA